MSFTYSTIYFEYWNDTQVGEQWGLVIADFDGDGFLDLYANHHGTKVGREIIYGFATDAPRHVLFEPRYADFHGLTAFDIDQDGDLDILQSVGGLMGTIDDPSIVTHWNRVFLNTDGLVDDADRIELFSGEDFGLQYGPGRGRLMIPVNLDGQLAIYNGVRADRDDGLYRGDFFARTETGIYSLIRPLGDAVSGEFAKGVHFGSDRFVDIVNFDQQAQILQVFESVGAGGFGAAINLSRGRMIWDVATGDFDGDLDNDILVSRAEVSPIEGQQVYGSERLYTRKDGVWTSALVGPGRDTRAVAIAPGDFNNDGHLDYAALELVRGFDLQIFLNNGDGTFRLGERIQDADLGGENAYIYVGDFDRDGTLDLVATNSARQRRVENGVYVLVKGEPDDNHWLSIELEGVESEKNGLGSRVYVTSTDGHVQMREQDSAARFQAQDSTDLHFGLGLAEVSVVEVAWADGYRQFFYGLAADRHLTLTERRFSHYQQTYEGGEGNDTIVGSELRDYLLGGGGDDVLSGGDMADRLEGGDGDDILIGGSGSDVIMGNAGANTLSGGGDSDVFRYFLRADSLPKSRDTILDFQPGIDILDLSRVDANNLPDDQAFVFIGSDPFTGAHGELRFADGLLSADMNGDGIIDFQIVLEGVTELSESDFIL